jgi:hypothetical protein
MRIFYLIPFLLLVQSGYSQNLIPRIRLSLARTSKSATFDEKDLHTINGKMFVGKPFDVGIQAGVGVQIFKKLILDVRYTYGLKGFEYFTNDFDKNRVLEFSVCRPIHL